MHQGRGECVASADGIGDLHLEAWMLAAFVGGDEEAAAVAAGDANQLHFMRKQLPSRVFFARVSNSNRRMIFGSSSWFSLTMVASFIDSAKTSME